MRPTGVRRRRLIRRLVNLVLALGTTALVLDLCIVGLVPHLPPLGSAFDPSTGIWRIIAGDTTATTETIHLADMRSSASIAFDANGVPTITAGNDADAMLAEGYVTARYRLLEMDLERRLGEGTLSAVVGSAALSSDELQLSLGITRTAQAEWASLPAQSTERQLLLAYSAGVDAGITYLEAHNELPAAMRLLDYRPAPWTPIDSLVVQGDLSEELDYTTTPADTALLDKSLGPQRTAAWFPVTPTTYQAAYDPGPYRALPLVPIVGSAPDTSPTPAVATPPSAPTSAHATSAASGPLDESRHRVADSVMKLINDLTGTVRHYGASNNWVVAPSRSANGQALLANDPHLEQTLPSVWYEVALHTPDLSLSGVEAPGLPGILLGRNAQVAWGFTDTQNQATMLYREVLAPANHDYDFWRGAWHAFRQVDYRIAVAGGASVDYPVRISVHGPLLALPGGTYSVWWAGAIPNHDLTALAGLWHAANAGQVRRALVDWGAPTQNIAYADSSGHVGIVADGIYPEVAHGKPWLPLGGTGRDDVVGTIPPSQVPQVADPASGFAVSANQRPVENSYPYYIGTVADFFDPGFRAETITADLSASSALTPATMTSIETDVTDRLALDLAKPLLGALSTAQETSSSVASRRAAVQLISSWNWRMDAASSAAALYWTWLQDYARDVFQPWWSARQVPVSADANLAIKPATNAAMVDDLESWSLKAPADSALTLPDGTRRSARTVMVEAFHQAVSSLSRRFGPPSQWRWDRLQSREFPSLTAAAALAYGPRGASGDAFTPDAADGYPVAETGPSWREIIAVGTPRAGRAPYTSTGVYPGGQSENPLSPWYETWIADWWNGRSHPLPPPAAGSTFSAPYATWSLRP